MLERVKIPSPIVRRRREAGRRLAFLVGALLIALGAAVVAPSVSDVEATWNGALRLVQFAMPEMASNDERIVLRAPVEPTGFHPK